MKMTVYAYLRKLVKSTSVILCLKLPRVLKFTLAGKEFHTLTTLSAKNRYVKKKKKISHRLWSVAWELIPPFGPLSRQGLNQIKPDQTDGRLNLIASAFIQLYRSIYQQS